LGDRPLGAWAAARHRTILRLGSGRWPRPEWWGGFGVVAERYRGRVTRRLSA